MVSAGGGASRKMATVALGGHFGCCSDQDVYWFAGVGGHGFFEGLFYFCLGELGLEDYVAAGYVGFYFAEA
jgi:hypothetical protein